MERETKTLETPISKQKVEVLTYLVGREKRALSNVFLTGDLNFSMETQEIKGLNPDAMNAAQELGWKLIVVSIDGNKEGEEIEGKPFSIVEAILDMRSDDYDFVVASVNEVKGDGDFAKKKTT